MTTTESFREPWWQADGKKEGGLEPVDVTFEEDDLRVLAAELALVTGRESLVLAVRSKVHDLAWGFDLSFPAHPVAVAPGKGAEARGRTRAWKDVASGLLGGVRTVAAVRVPQLAEGDAALWLADLTVDGHVLLRCGVVGEGKESPGDIFRKTGVSVVQRRLEALLWQRVGETWERNLHDVLEASPIDSGNKGFQQQLDLVTREVVRLLGCDGAGLFTWREAWGGYFLDGYFGPAMEGRAALRAEDPPGRSGWWFHAAGDPSLVRKVSRVDASNGDGERALLWRKGTEGFAEINPAALKAFDQRYPEVTLECALAVRLEVPDDPLRPVLVAFGGKESPWASWAKEIFESWRRDDRDPTTRKPLRQLYTSVLRLVNDRVNRILQERRDRQCWAVASTGASWWVDAASAREEGRSILDAIREVAGAYSGTLWAFHRGRRRALALLHPLGESEREYEWHDPPEDSGLGSIVDRLRESRHSIGLTTIRRDSHRWEKRFEDDADWSPVAPNTAQWLKKYAQGRDEVTIGCAVLERGGETVGALTLAWRYPPLGRDRLEKLLVPVLNAVGASLAVLVALEEERNRAGRERELDQALDGVFQRWLKSVRDRNTQGPMAEAPGRYVGDVLAEIKRILGREAHYFRFEEWNRDSVTRTSSPGQKARRLDAPREAAPHDLDKSLVRALVEVAERAAEGRPLEPFDISFDYEESSMVQALAFPAVVGGTVAGFLAVEGTSEALQADLATWQGVALTVGYTSELLRRNVYRALDGRIGAEVSKAFQRQRDRRRKADVVAGVVARMARELSGARWAAVLEESALGSIRIAAQEGVTPAAARRIARRWEPLARTRESDDHRARCFDPARPGRWGPEFSGGPQGPTAGLVVPLRTPGAFHGWLLALAENYWSLDATRVVEALALRAAPFFAHALEIDRFFVNLASSQHATRSAWQHAYGALDDLEIRLERLRAMDDDTRNLLDVLDEAMELAGARMASALYLATYGQVEKIGGRGMDGSLAGLVRRVVRMYRVMAEDKELTLDFRSSATYAAARGDPLLVQLIVENLLENAIKYANRGRMVWVRLSRHVGQVVLTVGDEGQPFSGRTWEQYLEPLRRLDAGRGGFGVGLWVVADCCRRLGASLEPPRSREIGEGLHRVEITVRFIIGE